jgi:uncharacterized protein YPO0396
VVNRRRELDREHHQVTVEGQRINEYLRSLQGRQSNIDAPSLAIRERLAAALGVDETGLPFAGELIQVRPEHADWQGAAERVLRGFALSVLVPAERYDEASTWIDANHLGGRLVYYRVSPRITREAVPLRPERTLADLLDVKPGRFAEWVEREVGRRADHVCAADLAEFHRHPRAVTRNGQVKGGGGRHEKDDRFRIDDRTRWVLGWSNADKIDALLTSAADVQDSTTAVASELRDLTTAEQTRRGLLSALDKLSTFTDWAELDWRSSAAAITRLQTEQARLQRADSALAEIVERLAAAGRELEQAQRAAEQLVQDRGARRERLNGLARGREVAVAALQALTEAELEAVRSAYPEIAQVVTAPVTIEDCDRLEREHHDELSRRIDAAVDRQKLVGERVVKAMQQFRQAWPAETTELDADVATAPEYRALRERIAGDDLPRFEAEFKRQLNTNTINDLAGFHAWLTRSATLIKERIEVINDSLQAIEYNPGRMITLIAQPTDHQEIRAFRDELRACTDDVLVHSDQYGEDRFLRVQRIIERFRGRQGQTEVDRRWTHLVTDVRNWYDFAASERERETGREWEHYTDSDGKSGGQKEKLAYTILAASLAYQFRLEWGVEVSRDFRFAIIDEAFGRGSETSARYALDLFRKLGLQLLVVTPLQKVHVIEPYVRAVGYVENRTGERSQLRTLTIDEYRTERAETAVVAAARLVVSRTT